MTTDLIKRLRERSYKTHGGPSYTSSLLTEAADRIADLERELAEAVNELHCCDDVPLDRGGLAEGIAELRASRDAMSDAINRLRDRGEGQTAAPRA